MLTLMKNNNERNYEKELAKFWFGEDFGDLFDFDNKGMKTDITEEDGNVVVKIELAGYKKEDVTIDFEKGYLKVHAKRDVDNSKKYHLNERVKSEVSRTYFLGEDFKEDIKATMADGVLTVTLVRDVKPVRKIEIQ